MHAQFLYYKTFTRIVIIALTIFRNNLGIVLLFLILGSDVFAQTERNEVYRFLEIPSSAWASALGGNQVAIFAGNSSLMHINPAYLDESSAKNVSASFVNYLSDARYGFANYALHYSGIGTIGFGLRYAGYGELTEYDVNGENFGEFNAGDLALNGTISTQLSDKVRAGAGLDYIHSSYGEYVSSAFSGSAGLYYLNTETRFSAGLTIRNLGDQLNYYNETREDLPFDISVGISKKPEKFPFQVSLTLRQLHDWDLRVPGEVSAPNFGDQLFRHMILGGEAALGKNFNLRFGYNRWQHDQAKLNENFDFAGASIGVGINLKKVQIDISRSSLSDIGGIVQLSVRTKTH
ncbi:MAG: type IX secretion system protein PorQ [Balneolaceae bacterium]